MVDNLRFNRSVTGLILSHHDPIAVKTLPLCWKFKLTTYTKREKSKCLMAELYQNPPFFPFHPSLGPKEMAYIKIPKVLPSSWLLPMEIPGR